MIREPSSFEPIAVDYALTPAELAAVDRALFRHTGAYRVLLGVNVVIVVALLATRAAGYAVLVLVEAVGLAYLFVASGRRRWRRDPGARVHRHLLLDAEGVHVSTVGDRATLAWSAIRSVEHHGRCHYLFTGPKRALPIPDRALTPEQHARLSALAGRVASLP